MFPIINIANKAVSTYTLFIIIGVALSLWIAIKKGKRYELSLKNIIFATVSVFVGVFLGSHLLFAVTNLQPIKTLFSNATSMSFGEIAVALYKIFDGVLFYGGFFGGLLGLMFYCVAHEKKKQNAIFDIYAVCVPLVHFFGKIGCFMRGCCYGVESKIGLTIKNSSIVPEAAGVRRFPVSLIEAYCSLLLFLLLLRIFRKGKFCGRIAWIYALFYSPLRFLTEYLRADNSGRIWGSFSVSQWISIGVFCAAFLYFAVTIKTTFREIRSDNVLLDENKGFLKTALMDFITFGVYNLFVKARVVKDINITSAYCEKKRTMSYWLVHFVLGVLTLGVVWFIWNHRLAAKIGRELQRRNIDFLFSASDFWLWNVLGIIVLVGPSVYLHRLFKATNLINADYNRKKTT